MRDARRYSTTAKKYARIKQEERLSYAQLRKRLVADELDNYHAEEVIDEIYQQQENRRIGYHKTANVAYAFSIGLISIGAGLFFYWLGGGVNLIRDAQGTGWREYQFFIGIIVLMAIGISLVLYGWMEQKK